MRANESFGSQIRVIVAVALLGMVFAARAAVDPKDAPNVVVILADDLGYGDLGCYGAPRIRTPHLDRMAAQGMRFTSFYAAQAVCSASRAALLTGCYPNRVGIRGALGPGSRTGIRSAEQTLAEVFKERGYATAIVGKWHLGDRPAFLPTRHGFDEYFGLPYSNDMWPRHPENPKAYPPLPLMDGEQVVERMPDQNQLTARYTDRAVAFIEKHRRQRFFLYVAHSMPHVPLHVGARHEGRSGAGLYADVLRELDSSVGAILETLRRLNLDRKTLVVFTSDNGPWLLYGDHAGSAGRLREGKGTAFEGGVRVPCIVRWPGNIPRGRTSDEVVTMMDLMPTLARVIGARLSAERVIDGRDSWPVLAGKAGARSPHEAFYYFYDEELQAVRSGPWKLHLPHRYPVPTPPGGGGLPGKYAWKDIGLSLFNLQEDLGEARDVAAAHPEVVGRLQTLAEAMIDELGDRRLKRAGRGVRPAGIVEGE